MGAGCAAASANVVFHEHPRVKSWHFAIFPVFGGFCQKSKGASPARFASGFGPEAANLGVFRLFSFIFSPERHKSAFFKFFGPWKSHFYPSGSISPPPKKGRGIAAEFGPGTRRFRGCFKAFLAPKLGPNAPFFFVSGTLPRNCRGIPLPK